MITNPIKLAGAPGFGSAQLGEVKSKLTQGYNPSTDVAGGFIQALAKAGNLQSLVG